MQTLKSNTSRIVLAVAMLVLGALVILEWNAIKSPLSGACKALLGEKICESELRSIAASALWAIAILPLILVFELLIRAKKDQPLISVGLVQDFVWFVVLLFFVAFGLSAYTTFLDASIDAYFPLFEIGIVSSLPAYLQIVGVILISDFIGWFDHWVRHKVPFLWEFHKVHHTPRELNFFTNMRLHPVDYLAIATIGIPFLFLDLEVAVPTILGWTLFKEVHLYFIHGNIRTNLGPLRFILTTPQSHRIHHSIERRHQDRNFAVHFVIWDFLFGTQWKVWDEYPDTGVEDPDFPLEKSARLSDLGATLWRQFLYPFTRILGH